MVRTAAVPSRRLLVFTGAATLVASILAAPVAEGAGKPPATICYVAVDGGAVAAGSARLLTTALKGSGVTIHVGGTCVGKFTIARNLTLVGDATAGTGVLDGGGSGPVLTVASGATVLIAKLRITNGMAASGAGIYNNGTVSLSDGTIVTGNSANPRRGSGRGGGVFGVVGSSLTLRGDAIVSANYSKTFGGGIYNDGTTTLMDSASVADNTAGSSGGGLMTDGLLWITDQASITGNVGGAYGGGAQVRDLLAQGHATISRNTAAYTGGGIDIFGGNAVIDGEVSIAYNRVADGDGGGIYVWYNTDLTVGSSVTITQNSASSGDGSTYGRGGGIYNEAGSGTGNATRLIFLGAPTITSNTARIGGGVYNLEGVVVGCANLSGNSPQELYNENGTVDSCS